MPGAFKIGDHVSWNSEAGRVSGIIRRKISVPVEFKAIRDPTRRMSALGVCDLGTGQLEPQPADAPLEMRAGRARSPSRRRRR
jgi:hypothetical protein